MKRTLFLSFTERDVWCLFPTHSELSPKAHQRFKPLTGERLARFHKWARKGIKTSKTFVGTDTKSMISGQKRLF